VHQEALAGAEAGLGEEHVVRGREHLGEAARGGPVQAVRDRHQLALVHHCELPLAASADDRHDPVALGEALGAGAESGDLAGQLQARDVGR
jgi:hypothetical protein